jgi:hypothetical protein
LKKKQHTVKIEYLNPFTFRQMYLFISIVDFENIGKKTNEEKEVPHKKKISAIGL